MPDIDFNALASLLASQEKKDVELLFNIIFGIIVSGFGTIVYLKNKINKYQIMELAYKMNDINNNDDKVKKMYDLIEEVQKSFKNPFAKDNKK